jgi:ferrous iron transport protein B
MLSLNGPRKRKHRRRKHLRKREKVRVALVGQPNVGKSVIFNHWTGLGAIVSNYPGTTVEILEGTVYLSRHDVFAPRWHPRIKDWASSLEEPTELDEELLNSEDNEPRRGGGRRRFMRRFREWANRGYFDDEEGIRFEIVDLPGSYTIVSPTTEDERVTLRYLQQDAPDVIVNVVDATNLPRNLLLTLALLEFNIPVVVCLNQVDLARRMGIEIDFGKLEKLLGVPVIPTVAIQGNNLKLLLRTAARTCLVESKQSPRRLLFPDGIEAKLRKLENKLSTLQLVPTNLPIRILSQQLLEQYAECAECVESEIDQQEAMKTVQKVRDEIETEFGADVVLVLGEKRLDYSTYIMEQVQKGKGERVPFTEQISAVLTHRTWGLPIAIFIIIGSLLLVFAVATVFDATIGDFWELVINPTAEYLIYSYVPWPLIQIILFYGLVLGIQGWLFVALPFVATFYILLSILEDSGYLARIAFLLDAFMHRLGLHGRAIIPMLTGAGCNVPAVMGNRILNTKRERYIAGFLVVLVPCSAQLAVILGTVAFYGSIIFAFIIYGIILAIIIGLGTLLQHTLPGASHGLVMEIPPLRAPSAKPILKKTWIRFREFVYIALPMIVIGSAILGVLLEYGYLHLIIAPAAPLVTGWLGLPPETAAALIYGVLRKELTVELLFVLANGPLNTFMTMRQMFVFALVTTIYIPCIATLAVLGREYSWKYTAVLATTTITLAFLLGGVANWLLIGLGFP